MPVDDNGNRADVITDSTSTISRMTLGRTYELYLGATSRDCRQRLTKMLTDKYGASFLETMSSEGYEFAREYLRGLYAHINSDMTGFLDSLNEEEFRMHLKEVVERILTIYYPTDNEKNIVDVIDSLETSIYKPHSGKVNYVDPTGRLIRTVDDVRVGVVYFIWMEKIANTFSAVASAKVNNFGFPVKGTNLDKPRYPHSQTPGKFTGETESRIILSYMGQEAIAEMMDLALNPVSHKTVYLNALQSVKPFDQHYQIDRAAIPYGQGKGVQIFQHIFTASGATAVYKSKENT